MDSSEDEDNLDFAQGLFKFFTRGELLRKIYLTKRAKEILFILIKESKERTGDIEYESRFEEFMIAMTFIEDRLLGNKQKFRVSKTIANTLHYWMIDHKYHYLSGEKDFKIATQWVTNQWNANYSLSELCV